MFTRLADADVAALAVAFDLGLVAEYAPIAAGTINSNFALETITPGGEHSYFLRINEGKSEEDVAWEARLVESLAAGGVLTQPPLRATDGRRYAPFGKKWVSAFAWRSGRHLTADEIAPDSARRLGSALARLHVVGLDLPVTWRRTSIYDHAHLIARYRGFSASTDPALARAIAILGEELAFAAQAETVRRDATTGIIHGDLFRDNVLWEEGPSGHQEIVAILDFEQASGGSLAYDLAVCLNDWCWTGVVRLDLAEALLAGYQRVRPLTADDRAALLIEVRAAAVRFTITRITDVYLAGVSNPEKDFRAFLARCEGWRGPALGQLSSLL